MIPFFKKVSKNILIDLQKKPPLFYFKSCQYARKSYFSQSPGRGIDKIVLMDDVQKLKKEATKNFEIGRVLIGINHYMKAIEMCKELGEGDPELAICHHELAALLDSNEKHSEAVEHYLKALELYIRKDGEMNKTVSETYIAIGVNYQKLGQYTKAIEYLKKGGKISRIVFGKNSPQLTMVYGVLSACFYQLNDYENSIECAYRELDILNARSAGQAHMGTGESYFQIGRCYMMLKDNVEALVHFEKAYKILSKTVGENDQTTQITKTFINKLKKMDSI
jgi:tetratricopeptide (TPR) repeat protein